jgi:hypothetical protein
MATTPLLQETRGLPGDALIVLEVGLGLAEEVSVRHRLGSILLGGHGGSPMWSRLRSMKRHQ